MTVAAQTLDLTFQALANATRRAVIERLKTGPATVSELAKPFDMALPSFMQHLQVLEAGGLIRSRKQGRTRTVSIEPKTLQLSAEWLAAQSEIWEQRLDRLENYLDSLDGDETPIS